MSFIIGKTYQIVLNTDLDGNTLPFPHTMVGTCLSFDKEYATFLDPMTNIVRGMKLQQGVPTAKESTCKKADVKDKPPVSVAFKPKDAKPSPSATPSTPAKPDATPAKPDATPAKPDATPAKPDATPAKPEAKPDAKSEKALPSPALKESIVKRFKEFLTTSKPEFDADLQKDLESLQEPVTSTKIFPLMNGSPSFTAGVPNLLGLINTRYTKGDDTHFFLFNTKKIVDLTTKGFLFLISISDAEAKTYANKLPIKF